MSQLTSIILIGAENGKHKVMILIDLQRAFDSLDHKILLCKIKCIGLLKKEIKWFHSYLTNRENINCGVPQGSILRPLLFMLYINDTPQALSNTHIYLYADDTSIFCQHKDVTEIENILNKEFPNVCDWFVHNKVSVRFGEDIKIHCFQ